MVKTIPCATRLSLETLAHGYQALLNLGMQPRSISDILRMTTIHGIQSILGKSFWDTKPSGNALNAISAMLSSRTRNRSGSPEALDATLLDQANRINIMKENIKAFPGLLEENLNSNNPEIRRLAEIIRHQQDIGDE
jgi:hypothetical protein